MSSFTFVSARARRATTRARRPASITAALALVVFVLATCARAMENPFTRWRDGDRGEVKDSEVILEARNDDHVLKLDAKAFDKAIKRVKYNFVMFYAPWDGHSKAFMPRWISYAHQHKIAGTEMTFSLVDATKERELDRRFDIEEYPTLIMFRDGVPKTYRGDRSPEHLDKFVKRNVLKPARWLEGTDDVEAVSYTHLTLPTICSV